MFTVAFFNSKGGVGKSTLALGLAEFLAGNRDKKVLVIDLDGQASISGALLGRRRRHEAVANGQTLAGLVGAACKRSFSRDKLEQFIATRPSTDAKGSYLEAIDLVVSDMRSNQVARKGMTTTRHLLVLRDKIKPLLESLGYDFVLIDTPASPDEDNKLVMAGLIMSDFVVIPVEPSDMSLDAMPITFDLIDFVRRTAGNGKPSVIGLLGNKTDRRLQQYKSKFPAIIDAAEAGEIPPLFDNVLPPAPDLVKASDGTIDFRTLRERFDAHYDHVRKIAHELEQRCRKFEVSIDDSPGSYAERFLAILKGFESGRKAEGGADEA